MTQSSIKVGDTVRVLKVPPDVERFMPRETQELFRLCLGRTYTVRGFDDYGGLELHVHDTGREMRRHGVGHNTIWIEPEYVEHITNAA